VPSVFCTIELICVLSCEIENFFVLRGFCSSIDLLVDELPKSSTSPSSTPGTVLLNAALIDDALPTKPPVEGFGAAGVLLLELELGVVESLVSAGESIKTATPNSFGKNASEVNQKKHRHVFMVHNT
jgi:hypothetical protein